MNEKYKLEFIKLNTSIQNSPKQLTIILHKYKHLLKKVHDPSLLFSIFQKFLSIFFRADIFNQYEIVKILKGNTIKKKLIENFDPLIFKTEIISILMKNNYETTRCVLKFINSYLDLFIDDCEIITEVIFKNKKRLNCKIFDKKQDYKMAFYEIQKKRNKSFCKAENNICKSDKKIISSNSISDIIHHLKFVNDKFTMKIIIKYPILRRFYSENNNFSNEKNFLSFKEAKNLYKNFKMFNDEWNKNDFKLVDYSELYNTEENNYFNMYLLFKSYIKKGKYNKAIIIIESIKDLVGLNRDIMLMFNYFYDVLSGLNPDSLIIDLYGINKKSEYKFFKRCIKKNPI